MKLEVVVLPNSQETRVVGELDLYHVEHARAALRARISEVADISLNLAGVTLCDAAGLQLLVAAAHTARAAGKRFSLHEPSSAVLSCAAALGVRPASWTDSSAAFQT